MNRPQEISTFNPRQVQELKKLVSLGESQTLEFKRKAAHPEKIIREMIAFANMHGGILLLGVGDDKTLPGLKFPEDESHVVQEALKRYPWLVDKDNWSGPGHSHETIRNIIATRGGRGAARIAFSHEEWQKLMIQGS